MIPGRGSTNYDDDPYDLTASGPLLGLPDLRLAWSTPPSSRSTTASRRRIRPSRSGTSSRRRSPTPATCSRGWSRSSAAGWDRPDLGVSSNLTLEAVLKAIDASEEAVRERWRESGDLGDAAAWAVGQGGQQTLFAEPLTVERVHDRLLDLTGRGSRAREARAAASTRSRDCSPTGRGGRPTRPPPSAG